MHKTSANLETVLRNGKRVKVYSCCLESLVQKNIRDASQEEAKKERNREHETEWKGWKEERREGRKEERKIGRKEGRKVDDKEGNEKGKMAKSGVKKGR